ncbi:MAG: LysM domain-containing protein [Clostridia bacterium]|nr:LysM domain-containing protein [Clostridia bacterium]
MSQVKAYKAYTTREGDTFDALALSMYGDEKKASEIIQFNPDHADTLIFGANVALRLPIIELTEMPASLPPWRRNGGSA